MSAIWGVVALDKKERIPENLKEIFETTYKNTCKIERYESVEISNAYIGCGIQYITVEAEKEELPIVDQERGIIFTADCLLDNREEVIELLSSYQYDRCSLLKEPDGKLMYLTYLCMGKECTKVFRGLFTIAIWDEKKGTLTLASDQVAARCLYYIRRGNLVAFSTLLNPLLKLFPGIEQNMDYYKDFLLANPSVIYVVPGETAFKEISLMLPATQLEFSKEGERTYAYWSLEESVCNSYVEIGSDKSSHAYGEAFLTLYNSCVKDALRTSGNIGISMSSGLDSASIGALAARELEHSGKTLNSYTFVPYNKMEQAIDGNTVYDESVLVNEIAKMYPNIKTTFLNNKGKNIFDDMNFCMKLLEMPYKTGTFPNHLEMCREGASAGCKVFLNGGFGNNTVSYGEINHILYDLFTKKRYGKLLQYINYYGTHEKISRKKIFCELLKSFHIFDKNQECFFDKFIPSNLFLLPAILHDYDFKKRFSEDKRIVVSEGYIDSEHYKEHIKATGLLIYLGVFETKFGLHTGMMLRDPTKDMRMMSFCYQLPYHLYADKGMPRWLIRKQFENLLPDVLLEKWQQRGVLNIDWMNHIYRDWDKIKPELLTNLSEDMLDEWMDKKRVIAALKNVGKNKEKDKYIISYICAIVSVLRFIKLPI